MNNIERKLFWDTLCDIRDNTPNSLQELLATIKTPDCLCRFRSLSENSLLQLQENKLYYSSADYYDDPFDTFIHVDYFRVKGLYRFPKSLLDSGNPDLRNMIIALEPLFGMSTEQILDNMKNQPLDISIFPERIREIRTIIQKNLFSICFCEDALNETLWLKYADNYKGFALIYDVKDDDSFLCGKEKMCENCRSLTEKPFIYPVYYTEVPYDATRFALACMLLGEQVPQQIIEFCCKGVMWEAERVSLIKKKCHEYDQEWRMIRPTMMPDRTCIKMKPHKVILGLRMPEDEKRLVISAAKVAGISNIEELYINDSDQLDTRGITSE